MYVRWFDQISRADIAQVGGKAANLGELTTAGLPVPPGLVLTTDAYRRFVTEQRIADRLLELARRARADDPAGTGQVADEIATVITTTDLPDDVADELTSARRELGADRVAVRSSATAEDLADASFAGQQETFLGVGPDEALLDAVRRCWASLWSARALAYRIRQRIDPAEVTMAVVVQRMVSADAAGVMFTANPTNGRRHETAISAAWGLGEPVVSGQVDTDELVVDTGAHVVTARRTADKQVQVRTADTGTETVDVPADRRKAPVLTDQQAVELAAWGTRVEQHHQSPQDIEWALDGTGFLLTQARPITALPPETGPEPTSWTTPRRHAMYVRASIVEQLPDPLTPLFADVTAAHVVGGMAATMAEVLGRDDLFTDDGGVTFDTVNGYAYYAYGNTSMAVLMARAVLGLRGVLSKGLRGGPAYWAGVAHPRYRRIVAEQAGRDPGALTANELVGSAYRLAQAGFAYYTAVQTVIPIVALSETALTAFCRRLRRPGDPSPETLLFGYDSAPIRAEKSLYDLACWTKEDPELTAILLAADGFAGLTDGTEGEPADDRQRFAQWRSRFADHLAVHGHAVWNLDFATPTTTDDPDLLWEVFTHYLRGDGQDPYLRQHEAIRARTDGAATIEAHLPWALRRTFARLLARAQQLAPVREDALADVGLAWPILRRFLRTVGARLVAVGALDEADDVFWLRSAELAELAQALDAGAGVLPSRSVVVAERRIIWRGQRRAAPPPLLPERSAWHVLDAWMPSAPHDQQGREIKGIGGSGGTVTAVARVLDGPADFGEFRAGEVLVARITTPAWTPLFAMAAGVVTDIGGPLSHSSIVAREYAIPAVLGTGVATRRLGSGQEITVDGTAGTATPVED